MLGKTILETARESTASGKGKEEGIPPGICLLSFSQENLFGSSVCVLKRSGPRALFWKKRCQNPQQGAAGETQGDL